MKKFLYTILLVCILNATDETPKATQLEMFLFKIGFTSMLEDFKVEKNTTKANSEDIKELKANVNYILEQMNKKKLEEQSNSITVVKQDEKLLEEIEKLKDEIRQLKSTQHIKENSEIKNSKVIKIETTQTVQDLKKEQPKVIENNVAVKEESKLLKIDAQKAKVRNAPYADAKVIGFLNFGTQVTIEYCDKYGWCKIESKEEYLPKFILTKF